MNLDLVSKGEDAASWAKDTRVRSPNFTPIRQSGEIHQGRLVLSKRLARLVTIF